MAGEYGGRRDVLEGTGDASDLLTMVQSKDEQPGDNCICQQSRFLAAVPVQGLLLPCSFGNYPPAWVSPCQCVVCSFNTACLSPFVFPSPVPTVSLPLVCPQQLLFELNLFYLLSGGGRLFRLRLPCSRGITKWDMLGQWYFIRQHY